MFHSVDKFQLNFIENDIPGNRIKVITKIKKTFKGKGNIFLKTCFRKIKSVFF